MRPKFSYLCRWLPGRLIDQIEKDLANIIRPLRGAVDDLDELEVLVILLEDRRFFQHGGIDLRSFVREFYKLITLQRFGGASTIDMQFVRTRTGYRDRTFRRKIYEMLLAWALQTKMDKIQILRAYLSEVYLGTRITGVECAAQVVFRKARYELTREEAAFVASMMVYPRPMRPTESWRIQVERRAKYGLSLYTKAGQSYRRQQD